ncbi:ComEC/Rec2 family competence protein [uncultured Friedmanniella sp.]|uniref:ComEC/Rec2 family competence protein n=1 Tax=uncultured Friedmanniella sp. TaxID=335381 RepID=UPI0035C9BFF8
MSVSEPTDGPGSAGESGPTGRDLRTVPLALGGWAACWIGTGGRGWLVTAAVLTAAVAGAAAVAAGTRTRRRGRSSGAAGHVGDRAVRPWVLATAVTVAVCAVLGAWQVHRLGSGPSADLARDGAWVSARALIRSDPHSYPARGALPPLVTVRVEVRELQGRGSGWRVRAPVLLRVSGAAGGDWARLPVGTSVALSGRLQPAEPGDDVAASLQVRGPPEVVARPGPGLRLVERVRSGLRASVQHRRPEPRALVPALVLGDTSALTPELQAEFRTTGLTHLTAVSGANLTLLLAFLLLAARWLGVRGWWLRLVGLGAVVVFVALCRTEPSVLRAAAMGLVALAALGSGSRRAGLRNLAVAMVLLLLLDPFLARSWGFALSVLASGGIIWWSRPWADVLGRWAPRVVAEPLALALAAHLATLPAVAALSGTVSTSGLLANAVAGPFVGPATVLGFAAAGSSLVSSHLAAILAFGAAWSAQVILWVAHVGAGLPGGSRAWPTTPAALALLVVGCAAGACVVPWVLARRWLSVLLAVLMVLALARAPTVPGWPPSGWRFVVCGSFPSRTCVLP